MRKGTLALLLSVVMVLGGMTAVFGGAAGDSVGNDDFTTADAVTPGTFSGSNTDTADPEDYYKFTLTAGQYFTVNYTVTQGGAGEEGKCTVYDKEKGYWDSSGWLSQGLSWTRQFTLGQADAGTYYIMTEGGTVTYDVKLAAFDQWDGDQPGDAGDELNTARAVTPPVKFGGWLADKDMEDYFSFSVPHGSKIRAELTCGDRPTEQTKLTIFRPNKEYLTSTDWVNPSLEQTLTHQTSDTSGGTYYFRLEGDTQNYTVDLSLTPENDSGSGMDVPPSIDNAYLLPGNGTYQGYLFDDDQEDSYKLAIAPGQMMEFTLAAGTTETEQVKMTVYKPDKNYLDSTDWLNPGIGTAWNHVTNNLGGGTYYIKIEGANSYTLMILLTMQNDTGQGIDAGDSMETATPILGNTDYTGLMRDMDGEDHYQFAGSREQKLTVNFNNTKGQDTIKVTIYKPDKVYADSSDWMNVGVPGILEYTPASTGTHYLKFEASNASYTFNVSMPVTDTEKPTVTVVSPANGSTVSSASVNLSGTAGDNVGLQKVEVSLSGITWQMATGTENWTHAGLVIGIGGNTIYAKATDLAGNYNITSVLVTYISGNDTVKPVVAVTSPANGSTVRNSSVNLTGTASDNVAVAKVEVSLSGITWQAAAGTTSWTYSGLVIGEGGNSIWVKATDTSGNYNITSLTVTYTPAGNDTEKPVITVSTPKDRSKVTKNRVLLSGAVIDDTELEKVEFTVNGVKVQILEIFGAFIGNITLKEGKNTIIVTATDTSGNVATAVITVTYEKPKPQPGFEGLFLIAAVVVGLALLGRRKRA